MSNWEALLHNFSSKRVLVIGDVMIDSYLFGRVDRISPEAPVPVVSVTSRDRRLGGAANVALNLKALGAQVGMLGVCGEDENGEAMIELFKEKDIETEGLIRSATRRTTVKHRIIGNKHQMLRVDDEDTEELNTKETERVLNFLKEELSSFDVVLFEDYNKGLLTEEVIRTAIELANTANVPTVVDPKKKHFLDYHAVSLFKPNLKEIQEGLSISVDVHKAGDVEHAMQALKDLLKGSDVMVTLSEHGVAYLAEKEFLHIPAHKRDISDVSGAGDTVISVAALALACGAQPQEIAALSNLAGGLVCEELGVVPVDKNALLQEAMRLYP